MRRLRSSVSHPEKPRTRRLAFAENDLLKAKDWPSQNPKRRRLPLIATRRAQRVLVIVSVLSLIFASGFWLSLSLQGEAILAQASNLLLSGSADLGYRVNSVVVEGRERTDREALLAALELQRDDPIMAVDLEKARLNLEAISWIEEASLTRVLPSEIQIILKERHPVAIWQNKGSYRLVDGKGVTIGEEEDALHYMAENPLLLIVGEGAPAEAEPLFRLLARYPAIRERIKAAQWISQRRWTLRLDDAALGLAIRLPEEKPEEALRALMALDQSDQILARKVSLIDLRLPDRVILRAAPMQRLNQDMPDSKPGDRDA